MSRFPVLLAALALCAAVTACGGGTSTAAADESGPPSWFASLCAADELAASGDVAGADGRFYNDVHEQLHALARDLSESDRAAAARLLVAKQSVEAGLEAQPPPDDLSARFASLLDATREGLDIGGTPVDGCPVGGGS